jgi:hypothetical protein
MKRKINWMAVIAWGFVGLALVVIFAFFGAIFWWG